MNLIFTNKISYSFLFLPYDFPASDTYIIDFKKKRAFPMWLSNLYYGYERLGDCPTQKSSRLTVMVYRFIYIYVNFAVTSDIHT